MTNQDETQPQAPKHHEQVRVLVDEFASGDPAHDVRVHPQDWRERGVNHLYRRDVLLVRDHDLARVRAQVGGTPVDNLINGVTVLAVEDEDVDDALRRIDARHGVGVATPDHVVYITTGTFCPATEPEETDQVDPWPAVADDRTKGDGVRVVVVDTGLIESAPSKHAWLENVSGDAEDPLGPDQEIRPYAGHGTFAAGVVATMAPAADIVVKAVLQRGGAVFESEIIRALDNALDETPDIISLSAGAVTRHNLPLLTFDVFWRQRLSNYKGVAVVTAVGNDAERRFFWPAGFPWTVSVGSLSKDGSSRAAFTNYGSWVDVYAPGEGLVNAFATGRYPCREPPNVGQVRNFSGMCRWSGTSFSTPLVAGLIAARMTQAHENGQQAADAVLKIARAGGKPGVGPRLLP